MRQFMLGSEVTVIDPEGEYTTLANTLGGEVIEFSANSPVKINPFDLSDVYEEGENELGLKILSLNGLLKIIMGQLDAAHDAILDKALVETYRAKGITPDPATQKKAPPLMEDLYKTLLGMEDPNAKELAFRLEKFIKGSVAGIFNQPSNIDLTIFNIRNLEEELRPIAMHIILDFIWTKVKKTLKKRLLVLDEAWYMMKYQDSASYVYSIAKRARKYYLGLTTATQDVEDFLSTDYGKAVLTNSSIQMLLKQGTAEVDMISQVFNLSEGEKELLISADIGEGLFFAGQNHVAIKVLAAFFEHSLITSNPEEIAAANKAQQPGASTDPLASLLNNAASATTEQPATQQVPQQLPPAPTAPAAVLPQTELMTQQLLQTQVTPVPQPPMPPATPEYVNVVQAPQAPGQLPPQTPPAPQIP
jgi:conjugal transfer ATP-binding protein TraC